MLCECFQAQLVHNMLYHFQIGMYDLELVERLLMLFGGLGSSEVAQEEDRVGGFLG